MTLRVELTARAESDVDHILKYLRSRSPQGAATWANRWDEVLVDLGETASQKSLAPEDVYHDAEIRHVIFSTRRGRKYRAIFSIRDDLVLIAHVRGPGQDRIR